MTIPSYFVAHGAPLLALEQNDYTHFLSELGKTVQPKAIILFSAHWGSKSQMVSRVEQYDTIYDFYGFPQALYDIHYPAPGMPHLAERIEKLLKGKGILAEFDDARGLDHGAWVILRMLYPEADIPVISMSVNPMLTPSEQYQIGQALQSLRKEDVLIIGSGGTVHNLRAVNFTSEPLAVDEWALTFDKWLESNLVNWDLEALFQYRDKAPYNKEAVPLYGSEHFAPIFYAMGAAGESKKAQLLYRSFAYGNLSYSVWQFG